MGRDVRKMLLPHPTNRLVDWQRNMPVVCPVCEGIPESEGGRRMEVPWQNGCRPIKPAGGLRQISGHLPPFSAAGALMLQGPVCLEMIDVNRLRLFYGAA